MIWNRDLKDYKSTNTLAAVGYVLRKYAYMIAVVVLMYIGGGIELWL